MNTEKFTWVKTHEQLVDFLKTKEHEQIELINLLKSVGVQPFNDKISPDGLDVELDEIDPFTFFCYIHKYGSKRKVEILNSLSQKLNLKAPNDDNGLPSVQAQKVWLFPYKFARKNNEISRLWSFFRKALNNTITDSDFQDILTINSVGKTKITEVLFYIKPDKYLPINGPSKPFIQEELGINTDFNTFSEYVTILKQISEITDLPFYELSYRAYVWQTNKKESMQKSYSFSSQLISFLKQAKTNNLRSRDYLKNYKDTKVKVSFGQGVSARVPWISFLKTPHTTSNGIYPVYLFYKELDILILAYGISESNIPDSSWDIQNPKSISAYFKEHNLGQPDRYGSSYVYKVYNPNNLPDHEILDNDLNVLLDYYLDNDLNPNAKNMEHLQLDRNTFLHDLRRAGLIFNSTLVTRFVASLITKPFVILTGLSGSGKTKLAQSFTQWICQDESQHRIIPVGADWTNREPLLGYPNALKPEEYVRPDSDVLGLIIQANMNSNLPHFLILDEMNLSHVERYFADFLSVMESGKEIPLYAEGTVTNGVPAKLHLPDNLFIIGTVNIDETTNMFSPKVLDRANTIEFRVSEHEMKYFLESISEIDMSSLTSKGAGMAKSFLKLSKMKSFATENIPELSTTLVRFFRELKKTGAEFGYRSATEIIRLINQLGNLDGKLSPNEKVDIAINQKLLPKLHGSRRKLCPVLETLGTFCVTDKVNILKDVFEKEDFDFYGPEVLYPLSLEKIARMYKGAIDNGFASFAEA